MKVLLVNDSVDLLVERRLTSYLRSDFSRRKYKALRSLESIDLESLPIVEELASNDPDGSIRKHANNLLDGE